MKTVFCPIKNDQINGDDCYLLCAIADNDLSCRVLPEGVDGWSERKQKKCLKCRYHFPSDGDEQ